MLAGGDEFWSVELPGLFRATSLSGGHELWSHRILLRDSLWGTHDEIVSIPTPFLHQEETLVMLLTRNDVTIYNGRGGEFRSRTNLPSAAASPPAYDQATETWWILCREHLLFLTPELGWTTMRLPIVDEPFSLRVQDSFAVIGSLEGRVYGVALDRPVDPPKDMSSAPAK
jgi:hypothetical protein